MGVRRPRSTVAEPYTFRQRGRMHEHADAAPASAPPSDLYETLQVSPRADVEVIEAAYRVLARRYHPDLDASPGATARMARINHAWDVLREPDGRAAYDRERAGVATSAAPAAPAATAAYPDPAAAGPTLAVAPDRLLLSLRQGVARTLPLTVGTDPPGIRVDAAVTQGADWLAVRPASLRGLAEDRITVDVQSARLRPGIHLGAVTLSTSWEARSVPVQVKVRRAALPYRLLLLRRGGRQGGALAVAIVLLLAITAGLLALALLR